MVKKTVLSLCDRSSIMVLPWALAGYPCICVDVMGYDTVRNFKSGGQIVQLRCNIMNYEHPLYEEVGIIFAFPPCTHLAISGARHFASKGLGKLIQSLQLVNRVIKLIYDAGCPWMVENPVGRLSTCWRKPDHIFSPHEYGAYKKPSVDHYTKKTCLWVGNGFVMPAKKPVHPKHGSIIISTEYSGVDRKHLRSLTPAGFAQAVFEANHPNV